MPKKTEPAIKKQSPKMVKKQPGTAGYEKRLNTMRDDILKIVNEKTSVDLSTQDVGDEADAASQSAERELLFELSDNERHTLDAVEAALRKISLGTYGACEACQKKIAAERLKAIPHARYCISCQPRFDSPRG